MKRKTKVVQFPSPTIFCSCHDLSIRFTEEGARTLNEHASLAGYNNAQEYLLDMQALYTDIMQEIIKGDYDGLMLYKQKQDEFDSIEIGTYGLERLINEMKKRRVNKQS